LLALNASEKLHVKRNSVSISCRTQPQSCTSGSGSFSPDFRSSETRNSVSSHKPFIGSFQVLVWLRGQFLNSSRIDSRTPVGNSLLPSGLNPFKARKHFWASRFSGLAPASIESQRSRHSTKARLNHFSQHSGSEFSNINNCAPNHFSGPGNVCE